MRLLAVVCLLLAVVVPWRLLAADDPFEQDRGAPRQPDLAVVDSSGNGNDGVRQGHPEPGVAGRRGTAYAFSSRGSWIQVPSNDQLNPGTDDFMIAAWVRLDTPPRTAETYDVARKGLSFTLSGSFKLEIVAGGRVRCTISDDARLFGFVTGPERDIADGSWHRIGCARTMDRWSVLVDRSVTTKPYELGSIDNGFPLSLGSKYGSQDGMRDGRIDDVAMRVAASGGERGASTRDLLRALRSEPPVGLWHLDEVDK